MAQEQANFKENKVSTTGSVQTTIKKKAMSFNVTFDAEKKSSLEIYMPHFKEVLTQF